jgi:MtrB/PioB family decaheme-associated outer membrane protein
VRAGWTLLLLSWLVALPAAADTELGPVRVSGTAEAGARGVTGDDHSAKFEEYRDVPSGAFGALDLMIQSLDDTNYLRFGGDDLGEQDGDYFLEGGRWGHWGITSSYSLLPHNFSNQALSPYFEVKSGNLQLPFAPPVDTPTFEAAVRGASHDAQLGFQTNEGNIGAFFRPSESALVDVNYREIDKNGRRPDQLSFGFSNFVHFAEPVDEKTREGTADLSFARDTWSFGVNYTGSFFDNHDKSYQLANPAAFAGGSTLGAIAAAPDNTSHLASLTGSMLLPTPFVARIAGTFAYGVRTQNQDFVPITVNPTLTPAPLPASRLNGEVHPLLANVLFTARPTARTDVTARYRLYDYANRTPEILFRETATTDEELTAEDRHSYSPSYQTQNASLETAYRVNGAVKTTFGLAWEHWDRGREREVRSLDDYSPGVRLDWRTGIWSRVHASYAYHIRSGSEYDELAPFRVLEPGTALTPLTPPIRKYDMADSNSHVFHLQSDFFPRDDLDLSLAGNFKLTEYTEGNFGLLSDDSFDVGVELAYHPVERVEITIDYSYDQINLRQRSASSSGTLEWTSQHHDIGHTGGIDLSVGVIPDRLSFQAGLFVHKGNGRTQTKGAPADAVDFPEIDDTLWTASTSLSFKVDEHLTLIARYRYESYDENDFQFDGLGVTRLTSTMEGQPLLGTNNDVFLHNGLEDYGAHVFSASVVYRF